MSADPGAIALTLANLDGPWFALLDAARDRAILPFVAGSGRPYQTLYGGPDAERLGAFGPWLVELGPLGDSFERALIERGWGRSWGVFLGGGSDLAAIRRHLRRYLRVEIPGGDSALFRFYDPRVLRVFLPGWTPGETTQFFGPIRWFAMEDQEGPAAALQVHHAPDGVAFRETDDAEADESQTRVEVVP